ncbi:MAG: DUF2314 domain-containing protein [Chitinophagales bacterium]|nr:DUF2314 domain-containing protein [Chitinophagales bacterium]
MDKPLKYFLIISAVFVFLVGVFVWGTFTSNTEIQNEYAVVDETDSRMLQAKKQAVTTLDTFFALYPQHADSAFIRFSFEPTRDHVEHLWGKVKSLDKAYVNIQLKRKEGLEDVYYPEELELKIDRIEDWMIHVANGSIRGGYTAQAMMRKEKENASVNTDSLQKQFEKFIDGLE